MFDQQNFMFEHFSISWGNKAVEILGNVCIVIIFSPVYDVINSEINLSFLIKPFFYMTKK